jgi:hypothetical protein
LGQFTSRNQCGFLAAPLDTVRPSRFAVKLNLDRKHSVSPFEHERRRIRQLVDERPSSRRDTANAPARL